eukprot:TRINITY_DN750_c1_g1_i1.p1 TRINITY_DN750_c1_g1~~TRINITY_DN750_c1_g1_i1.p1  ORF type:complete len:231 (+),score=52.95 TRINITY_DN750_c1_g1_i1:85-777(+)
MLGRQQQYPGVMYWWEACLWTWHMTQREHQNEAQQSRTTVPSIPYFFLALSRIAQENTNMGRLPINPNVAYPRVPSRHTPQDTGMFLVEAVCQDHASTKNIPVSCGMVLCGLLSYGSIIGSLPLFVFAWAVRDKARKKYGIEGTVVCDCCASFWCSSCVLCQVHREASHHSMTPGFCCCRPSAVDKQQRVQVLVQTSEQAVQPSYVVGTPVTHIQKAEPQYPPPSAPPQL